MVDRHWLAVHCLSSGGLQPRRVWPLRGQMNRDSARTCSSRRWQIRSMRSQVTAGRCRIADPGAPIQRVRCLFRSRRRRNTKWSRRYRTPRRHDKSLRCPNRRRRRLIRVPSRSNVSMRSLIGLPRTLIRFRGANIRVPRLLSRSQRDCPPRAGRHAPRRRSADASFRHSPDFFCSLPKTA